MTICAERRTLIVAGLVLFLVKSGWNFPLPPHRKVYSPGNPLTMTRKPCQDPIGNVGVCMFKYDCIRKKGLTLSTCVDGFLFGACCSFNGDSPIKVPNIPFAKENEFNSHKSSNISIKPTNILFVNENDFNFHKPNNTTSEAEKHVANSDTSYLSNYSSPEYENFNSTLPSSFPELDVNISTYPSSNGIFNSFPQETTATLLSKNSTAFTSFSDLPINFTGVNNTSEIYPKNGNYQSSHNLLVNNFATSIDPISSITKEVTDNTEVTGDKLSYISHNITGSSYRTDVFNSTEPSAEVTYNWKPSVDTSFWWKTSKHSDEAFVEEYQNAPANPTPSSTDNISKLIENSSVSSATNFGNQTTQVLENFTNTDKTPFIEENNTSREILTTNVNNFTDYPEQKAAITNIYEFSNNQRYNLSTYIDDVSEIPSLNTEHTIPLPTTISQGNEKVTSKKISTDMKIPDEKSFTIYGLSTNSFVIEKDQESTISTEVDTLSNIRLSTTDRDSRITTQGLSGVSQWPAQHELPASFQSLVAQLTSEELPSPVTLKLNLKPQTLPSTDKITLNESKLSTGQTLGLVEHQGADSSENFEDINRFEEQQTSNGNKLTLRIPTGNSEITPFVSEHPIEITTNADNYNKTTPLTNSYATNFSSDKEFSQVINWESTVNSYEKHENSNKMEITTPTIHFKTPAAFETTGFATFSKNTTNPLQAHGGFANVSTTDSFNLHINNSSSLETSTFETSKDNNTLSNAIEFGNEWFETIFYVNFSKVPEIVNNHASKSTAATDIMNTTSKTGLSFVNITKLPVENYTTLGTVNNIFESHSTSLVNNTGSSPITQTLSLSTISENPHQAPEIDSTSSSSESVENAYPLITDTYFIETNTSQTLPPISTTTKVNQYAVNETTTITTIYTTSPFEPSHELAENMNLEEIKFNNTHVTNDIPSSFHEHLPDLISTSQINYTVFKDDLDNDNVTFTDGFNKNNVSSQLYELGFAENNFTSSISSLSTELTTQSVLNNGSVPLTTEMSFISNISKNEEINPSITITENANTSSSTIDRETFVNNPNTTYFGEIVENSTLSIEHTSIKTIASTIDSVPSVENSALFTRDVVTEEFTQKYNITLTSHNSNEWMETITNASMPPTTEVPEPPTTKLTEYTQQNIKWNYKKDCGVRLMQPIGRIVGGKNTYFGKWPWQALVKEATWLGLFVKNKCGGVLITAKYVLTAAHCQPGFFASLLVVLGTHDLSETFDNKASVIRNVKRMVVHRHYNAQTFENDLALLEMEAPVEFSPYVVPICLPYRKEDFTGKMAFVTGWGKLTHGGDVPNILQEVQVPIVANGDCQRMFFHAGHQKAIRSNFVCAGYTNGGQDSCEGDSGGPLMVQREDNRWVLVGTVSHGIGCADPNLPGVYMRMSSYRPWIDSIINKHR